MSRATSTILTNLCLIEDTSTNKVVLQYRSPERYKKWSGYAFPGGHIEEGESIAESVIREVYEETGLTITAPKQDSQVSSDHLKKEKFLGLRRTN